jgi:hypothetical protein
VSILDGTAELQPDPLARLCLERVRLGAAWLTGASRRDGSLYYRYFPDRDEYELRRYNEVRHAGTAYAMFQAWEIVRSRDLLAAAEGTAEYIRNESVPALGGRAFAYRGEMKLGGQALAVIALLERRRVLGDSHYDDLIADLATCLQAMELPDQPGRYFQSYSRRRPSLEPDSRYYPGEALLALTRLAQHFPQNDHLEHAARAAEFLVHVRDGDLPAAGAVPHDDHWLAIALSELYRLRAMPEYRAVALLQAERMRSRQHRAEHGLPMRIGANRSRVVRNTSTATKGEAMVAVWGMAAATGDQENAARFAEASRRNAQFLMRVQNTEDNTGLFPRPERAIGGWGQDAFNPMIRIDFVQHSIAQLLNVWHITTRGDVPMAGVGAAPPLAGP